MNKLNDLPYQTILFDGKWGIGKTKYIMDSINDKENVYYISLFGKKDINVFYQELYYLLLSKHKVKFKKVIDKIGKINFSQFGFNISIPLISDIFESIQEELENTTNITIIIDDLERKKDEFDIREVFGFVDSITKKEGTKVVLVASSDNFSTETKKNFEEYTEKSLDRIYKISTYSKDAPQKILGDDIWSAIKEIYQDNELKNLRTLEKANLFIKEVIKVIPSSIFTSKINKEDIYKICFSVVLFEVDYKGEMQPLTENDGKNHRAFHEAYNSKEKVPNYIWHYILKQNLNNPMMFKFIPTFLEWFSTGDFSKHQFNEIVKLVNTYVESRHPLFMSEEQIVKESEQFSTFINNLGQDISLKNILQRLDELANIIEKTELKFNYQADEVVNWITNSYDFNSYNDYDDTYFDILMRRESKFINEVLSKLQFKIKSNYKNNQIAVMVANAKKLDFTHNETNETAEFLRFFDRLKDEEKDNVVQEMKNNKWFLPLPLGEITDSHWTYCHNIFQCIVEIDGRVKGSIIKDVHDFCEREIEDATDKIFKYRLRSLIKQYLSV